MIRSVQVLVLPDGRISRAQAATYLGISPKTLANYATLGRGPRPRKIGGRIWYDLEDLKAFVTTGEREALPKAR